MIKAPYDNPYGTWKVTTEGDEEGRTTKNLGVYHGFVDEIALHLANKAFYGLRFTATSVPAGHLEPTATKVNVSFDIDSLAWNLHGINFIPEIAKIFKDRPVVITESFYYASFKIEAPNPEEAALKIKKQVALSKLSDEEKELLGLK